MFGCLVVSSFGSRAMFSGCLSDLGLGLGGLCLENIDLDPSDNFFTLIVCFAMSFLLCGSGAITVERSGVGWLGSFSFLPFMLFWYV